MQAGVGGGGASGQKPGLRLSDLNQLKPRLGHVFLSLTFSLLRMRNELGGFPAGVPGVLGFQEHLEGEPVGPSPRFPAMQSTWTGFPNWDAFVKMTPLKTKPV